MSAENGWNFDVFKFRTQRVAGVALTPAQQRMLLKDWASDEELRRDDPHRA
jgi:hypothetical protein